MLLQSGIVSSAAVERAIHRELFSIGNTPVTLATLVAAAITVALTMGVSVLARRGARRALMAGSKADPATVSIATRLVHYLVLLVGFGIALQTIGINVSALFTAGAFFAVAVGFAMQTVAQNFVAGIILMTERTIKANDILEVEGTVVRVMSMGLRATIVRSRDEEDLIIPNATLVQNTVTNYTLRDSNYRLRAPIGVSYSSDVAEVLQILRKAADLFEHRSSAFEPVVLLSGFGDSSVNFEVSVWISDPWAARRMLSDLNIALWNALKENGVVIPFPQRDVHLYGP